MFKQIHRLILVMLIGALVVGGAAVIAQDEPYAPEVDPANFVEGIDHAFMPWTPGTTYVYEGETEDGMERIEVYVTFETKEVMGITATVVRDTVWLEGEIIEDTLDWYAQDKDGNVWYMGEDSKEYEDGVAINTEGSWEAGVDGALPGIIMPADPQPGDRYRQEYYAGEAEDMAEVVSLTESVEVPYGAFDDLLMTLEWTPLESDSAEHKYYAPGVGLILEAAVEDEEEEEQIELVNMYVRDRGEVDDEDHDDDEDDDDAEHAAKLPAGTPIISEDEALEIAQEHLGSADEADEIELELEDGTWVYSIEIGEAEVEIDALTGEVLEVETDDD